MVTLNKIVLFEQLVLPDYSSVLLGNCDFCNIDVRQCAVATLSVRTDRKK